MDKIHLPSKKITSNDQGVIKLNRDAMEVLAEIVNQTNMSIRHVASEVIVQAYRNGLISFDREEADDAD